MVDEELKRPDGCRPKEINDIMENVDDTVNDKPKDDAA
jgi:hypothetical protein